jgi:flagellar FliL protein
MAEKTDPKAAEPEQEAAPPKKRSLFKLALVGVLALILIGGAAAAVLFFTGGGEEGAEQSESAEQGLPEFGPIVPLGEFTVNLNEGAGDRYLRVKIQMELAEEALQAEVEARLPLIHDTVLLLLSGLTRTDIETVEGKERLKELITERVEQFLRPGSVRRILFEEILVQ